MFKFGFFKKNIFLKYLAVLILFIFLHFFGILRPLENFISYIFLPINSDLYKKGNDILLTWKESNLNLKEVAEHNKLLKEKIVELTIEKSKLFELESENKTLRDIANFFEENDYEYLTSRIIGSNLEQNSNSYILDKGKKDGVKKGQPVVDSSGAIVGKIRDVYDNYSELLLLIDNKSALAVLIQNKDNSQGILEGQYGLSMRLNLIPQNENINKEDIVITSGIEQLVPRGLLVGRIDKIENKVNELFQSAIVSPVVDYKKLNIVSILIQD